jgi:hypothetical protein
MFILSLVLIIMFLIFLLLLLLNVRCAGFCWIDWRCKVSDWYFQSCLAVDRAVVFVLLCIKK